MEFAPGYKASGAKVIVLPLLSVGNVPQLVVGMAESVLFSFSFSFFSL